MHSFRLTIIVAVLACLVVCCKLNRHSYSCGAHWPNPAIRPKNEQIGVSRKCE